MQMKMIIDTPNFYYHSMQIEFLRIYNSSMYNICLAVRRRRQLDHVLHLSVRRQVGYIHHLHVPSAYVYKWINSN